ncbi:MAG: GspE/PulE family protein [Verrucomicrobiota bacterium]
MADESQVTLQGQENGAGHAPQILADLIQQAERARASDIHLQMRGAVAEVALRLDGVIAPVTQLPASVAERVIGRVKFLARLKTYQDSLPQDGRIERAEAGSQHDIRVATYPTVTGEKIVLRLFNTTAVITLGELGLPEHAESEVERFLQQTTGLMLLTGPAGSGKTTTIYACLRHLADQGGRHIITVEDPVEQIVPGTMQTEVNEAIGLDFARAARHLLRQDPQALIIGEIRDDETANLAVRAGLTGHLVISTLHAGSCRGVFERLLVLCPDNSAIASSVELVLNQRLIRRLCPACQGAKCATCLHTGYQGRVPLVEWLRLNDSTRTQIRSGDLQNITPQPTLAESARDLVSRGLSNQIEMQRVLGL